MNPLAPIVAVVEWKKWPIWPKNRSKGIPWLCSWIILLYYIFVHTSYPHVHPDCSTISILHPHRPIGWQARLRREERIGGRCLVKAAGRQPYAVLFFSHVEIGMRHVLFGFQIYIYITIYFKGEIIGNAHLMYIIYIYIFIYVFVWKVTVWKHPKFGRTRYMVYGFGFTAFWYQRRILWEPEPAAWMI